MSTRTVRISKSSHEMLKNLAAQTRQTMAGVLESALDAYRRKVFFEQLNAGYAEFWAEYQADATLVIGLDTDENWTEEGCPISQFNLPQPA